MVVGHPDDTCPAMGSPTFLTLTEADRAQLDIWFASSHTPAEVRMRIQIVLAASEGQLNSTIAQCLNVSLPTVSYWRNRFRRGGPWALMDEAEAPENRDARLPRQRMTLRELTERAGIPIAGATAQKAVDFRHEDIPFLSVVGAHFQTPYHAIVLTSASTTEVVKADPALIKGNFFLLARCYEALRAGQATGLPPMFSFRNWLETVEDRTHPDLHLYLLVDFWEQRQNAALSMFLRQHARVHVRPLSSDIEWLDWMRSWFQPMVVRNMAEGRMAHFSRLEEAFGDFMLEGREDPFVWMA